MTARHQHEHEAINAREYPGTRQLCSTCDDPTGRCEDDSIYTEEGEGPLCLECWHKTPEYILEDDARLALATDRLNPYPRTTMKTPHKHAALMAEYAKDAAETERPWERWECNNGEAQECAWRPCSQHPAWATWMGFRRKPKTITINGIEVPEPLRVTPEIGTRYFLATTTGVNYSRIEWDGIDEVELLWFERGLIHLDRESALTHIRALLSFTQQNQITPIKHERI